MTIKLVIFFPPFFFSEYPNIEQTLVWQILLIKVWRWQDLNPGSLDHEPTLLTTWPLPQSSTKDDLVYPGEPLLGVNSI